MKRINRYFRRNLHWFIVLGVSALCALFIIFGHTSKDGNYRTLDGNDAVIPETTTEFIEEAEAAMQRIMNEDKPTDDETVQENAEGQGSITTLEQILARRLPDGNNDNGLGWQCSKYTAYLATGKREYSNSHPDYGPVNGKDIASWLVKNYGFKYIDNPVKGAIGSGGFNTKYGHTAMYLYSTSANTAMVNDANFTPLKVSTHEMNITGWVWVVPNSYAPEVKPEVKPTENQPAETKHEQVTSSIRYLVKKGDTMSGIMKAREGRVDWQKMNEYASHWYSLRTGKSVYYGWTNGNGYGLIAGDTIEWR